MSIIISRKKSTQSSLSPQQKTFNRLKKKFESLQQRLQSVQQECDHCLLFYYDHIQPEKQALITSLKEFIKAAYEQYKKIPKHFSKKELKIFKDLILNKINLFFECTTFAYNQADPEISEIFKELEGVSYEEVVADELSVMKQGMQEMFKENGLDVDLSTIELTDDEYTINKKIFEAMDAAKSAQEEEEPVVKPKNKKQLEKELKAQELEQVQKKGLNSIYKQLAKAFHPDLEQDPEQKIEKENLMKKLTCAYENNDLHTLLFLEMDWTNRSNNEKKTQSNEQLTLYNSILKNQVEELQNSIEVVIHHPKYLPIQSYLEENFLDGMAVLHDLRDQIKTDIMDFQKMTHDLTSAKAEKTIRSILREYQEYQSFQMIFNQLEELEEEFERYS